MEFVIVKAEKAKKLKVKKTKYGRLFTQMEKLKPGDHVIAFPQVEERLINQRLHNMMRGLASFKELLPKRRFEMSTMTSSNGSDIIVKRLE